MNTKIILSAVALCFVLSSCKVGFVSNTEPFVSTSSITDVTIPSLDVSFTQSDWDGIDIKYYNLCKRLGGNGKSPELLVKNIPPQTNVIAVEFNDRNCPFLAWGGGYGTVGYHHDGSPEAILVSVPTESAVLPSQAFKIARHRMHTFNNEASSSSCGGREYELYVKNQQKKGDFLEGEEADYGSAYLAPCTGQKHSYYADVKALYRPNPSSDRRQKVLAIGRIELGRD